MHKIIFLTLVFSYWSNIFSQQLYLTKRDYSDSSNYIHSLIEIDQENGNTISSYDFVTLFPGSYSPESLVFNEQTNQIFGITSGGINFGGIVVKFNPTTNTENSFELPNTQSVDYGDLIIIQDSSLGFNDQFQQNTKLEPIKAYNLLGKEVPLNTKNEIIILVYKNGITKKVLIKD